MCNPNGDPDNENKPRMDVPTSTNLVTDLRIKRYLRDYLEEFEKKAVYVSNPEGIVLNAGDRLKFWQWRKANPTAKAEVEKIRKEKLDSISKDEVLNAFIDTRLFGATIPIKGEEKEAGSSIKFIGPVQLNWAKSLNEVELVDSSGITSHFSSTEGKQGTMGTDYRVYYSLIATHGIISANRAKETGLMQADIDLMDKAFVKSIPLLATRTKVGQYPRLYIRVKYNSADVCIGDLRKYIILKNKVKLRSIKDVEVDFAQLFGVLEKYDGIISEIIYWADSNIKFDPSKAKNSKKYKLLSV
jgi:CRISPR-associated protein Csh2